MGSQINLVQIYRFGIFLKKHFQYDTTFISFSFYKDFLKTKVSQLEMFQKMSLEEEVLILIWHITSYHFKISINLSFKLYL